ncbi:MAG: hypothetical protein ACFE0O_13240 [Opitutales bacterium]
MTLRSAYPVAGAIGLLLLFTCGCTEGFRIARISPLPQQDQIVQAQTGLLGNTASDLSLYFSIRPHETYRRVAAVSYAVVNHGDETVPFGPQSLSVQTDQGHILDILTPGRVEEMVQDRFAGYASIEIARLASEYHVRNRLPDLAEPGRMADGRTLRGQTALPQERIPEAVRDQIHRNYRRLAHTESATILANYLLRQSLAPGQRQEGQFFVKLPYGFSGQLALVAFPETDAAAYAFLVE